MARETLPAMRKDVTAKCYGGDISRKRKLLDKQKEDKKKMRQFDKVEIPQEAFISAMKMDETSRHHMTVIWPTYKAGSFAYIQCTIGKSTCVDNCYHS